ncbi:hypothetical protein D917_03513 [Trichinella nativa]|uniref:Uncharacterized protein n=1 Tax=Trichinella nativa TaxID=6335 RepID=A0A1Y3E995_9BILA|nr:hypothetical protein D917_03513 [Trichinella nativa]
MVIDNNKYEDETFQMRRQFIISETFGPVKGLFGLAIIQTDTSQPRPNESVSFKLLPLLKRKLKRFSLRNTPLDINKHKQPLHSANY